MVKEFYLTLEDKPGTFSHVTEALGYANINIEGFSGTSANGKSYIHFYTNNPDQTSSILTEKGFPYESYDVVCINLGNKPGEFAKFSKALYDAGVNITWGYTAMNNMQIIASDNYPKTKELATQFGIYQG